jgi:hypothetical protein
MLALVSGARDWHQLLLCWLLCQVHESDISSYYVGCCVRCTRLTSALIMLALVSGARDWHQLLLCWPLCQVPETDIHTWITYTAIMGPTNRPETLINNNNNNNNNNKETLRKRPEEAKQQLDLGGSLQSHAVLSSMEHIRWDFRHCGYKGRCTYRHVTVLRCPNLKQRKIIN